MRMMKKLLIAVLLMQLSTAAMAQEKTLLISESGLPYTAQTWFAYGSERIDQKDIVGCWDQGKRIVTAAYTGEGWFIIMAGNTGYSMQTYLVSDQWPEGWIAKKTQEGYAITSMFGRTHGTTLLPGLLSRRITATASLIWLSTVSSGWW